MRQRRTNNEPVLQHTPTEQSVTALVGDNPALELRDIRKRFGGVTALDGVTLDVRSGETVALVGDNGAGKSTLVKVVSGALQADSGTVHVEGRECVLRSPKDATRAGVHTVYQDLALAPNLTVVENLFLGAEEVLSFGRRVLRRPDEIGMELKATRFLADLGLTTVSDVQTEAGYLSGGQRQTIAIARSILRKSRVLLLDEPTAALGVHESRHVLDLVARLKREDIAVMIVSHNMHEVFEVADRIIVLRLGRVAATFRREEVTPETVVGAIMGVGV